MVAPLAVAAFPLATSAGRPDLDALRAQGPAGLDAALAAFDRAAPEDRAALAADVDVVAGQRYATVSRLYWYTDLALAQQAARELDRPILALRMLGDLRDDLSCANSRLFRATLYANTELAAFLRSQFVLYWSSERAVPRVTIDFGDGRQLVRTTTGNSAHYVLDASGNVLDVLPGLYTPRVFREELEKALVLARQVKDMPRAQQIQATIAYHQAAIETTHRLWEQVYHLSVPDSLYLLPQTALGRPGAPPRPGLALAQAATMSKALIEVPVLRAAGLVGPDDVPRSSEAWSYFGQTAWSIVAPPHPIGNVAPPAILDAASLALVARLHNAGLVEDRATPAEIARVIARLERNIVADTAINEFRLRQDIRRRIVRHAVLDFAPLNAWIYEEVFATPASDRWLGLLPRTDFSGLPGDGVVMP